MKTPEEHLAERGAIIETFRPKQAGPILAAAEWLARDLPEPDFIMGAWLATTSRALITGPTGLGKTNFGMALGVAVASGADFLHWSGSGRPHRVLYIDGEMSRRLMKQRLADAARRAGGMPSGLYVLSREDAEDMPPLNTEDGQRFIDGIIDRVGGVNLIIFDNIQALLVGIMKDEEQWQATLPWIRTLTRRNIGQIWFHHTGHDESRSYGSKAREWQLDTCLLMERDESGADLAFGLKFTKARERMPSNREDFEPVAVALVGDAWTCDRQVEGRKGKPLSPKATAFRDALTDAIVAAGETRGKVQATRLSSWQAECERKGLIDKVDGTRPTANRRIALFSKYRAELVAARAAVVDGDFAWLA